MARPHLDLFPVDVVTDDAAYPKSRLLAGGDRLLVFASERGAAVLRASAVACGPTAGLVLPGQVSTDLGVWQVRPTAGCGCGSVLRHMGADFLLGLAGLPAR